MRRWVVAGAVIETGDGLLLVQNRRRNGSSDWSTPGGVIDEADATVIAGLTREVREETGLRVARWEGPLYEVHAHAADLGWTMRCEVHRAVEFTGQLAVNDPDGIVVDAAFFEMDDCTSRLAGCLRWVREPLADWLAARWTVSDARRYRYDVRGSSLAELEVVRAKVV